MRARPRPAHPDQVAPSSATMLMASLGMPTMGMKWGGGGLSRDRGQLVSHFVGYSRFMEKERPPGKQRWLCSKGKAAFVCQYESNWVKSAVFYKSLLCLGAVGTEILGARSRSLLPAGRQQPTDALQTKLCIFSYSNMPSPLQSQMWSWFLTPL